MGTTGFRIRARRMQIAGPFARAELYSLHMNSTIETLGVDEAAALLCAEADTVMHLARRREMPGAKVGKAWVFMRSDVLSFLRAKIDAETLQRRKNPSSLLLGTIVEKPRHGRTKPRPVLPELSY